MISGIVNVVSSEDALLTVLFVLMLSNSEPENMEILALFTFLIFTRDTSKIRGKYYFLIDCTFPNFL